MFRSLGLAFCVVVMAAFVFGCGGGGGGGTMTGGDNMMPTDPGPTQPTDADRIAEAQQAVATILSNARTRASAASSAASALGTNQDATADQRARANNHDTAAQAALSRIESANTAAQAATTPTAAQAALTAAQTAQSTLNTEASAISSIQSNVRMVTNAREQQARDELARTGGSSLIRHLSDNRKVSDTVLDDLAATSLLVGSTADNASSATYLYHKGDSSASPIIPPTQYPKPANIDRGVLGVMVRVGSTEVLSSNSQTGKISGSGRLSNGFDLKNGNGKFATVYTDIEVAKLVRQRGGSDGSDLNNPLEDTTPDDGIDQRSQYVADTDYLLAGIWLDDETTAGSPVLRAFAFGSQPLIATHDFCTATDVTNPSSSVSRTCGSTSNTNMISGFVDENESENATYSGGVNGAYFAGGKTSHFKANVSLTANFVRGADVNNAVTVTGSKISGEITNIFAGGDSITGSIDLKEQPLTDNISGPFEAGEAAGVIAGHAYTGIWKGQFFGMRGKRLESTYTGTVAGGDRTEVRAYEPQAPNSVAGSFYVDRQTVGEGDAAFIGAFGAHR